MGITFYEYQFFDSPVRDDWAENQRVTQPTPFHIEFLLPQKAKSFHCAHSEDLLFLLPTCLLRIAPFGQPICSRGKSTRTYKKGKKAISHLGAVHSYNILMRMWRVSIFIAALGRRCN